MMLATTNYSESKSFPQLSLVAGREGQLTRPGCLHGSLGCGRSYVAVALMSSRRYVGRPYVSRPYVGRPYVGRPIVLVPIYIYNCWYFSTII